MFVSAQRTREYHHILYIFIGSRAPDVVVATACHNGDKCRSRALPSTGDRVNTAQFASSVPVRQELDIASLAICALNSLGAGGCDGSVLVSGRTHVNQGPAMGLLELRNLSCGAAKHTDSYNISECRTL